MAHTCVTMKVSIARRVSHMTSFEMGLSRSVLDATGVPTLRSTPMLKFYIRTCYPIGVLKRYGMDIEGITRRMDMRDVPVI